MSANEVAMMLRMPKSYSAQGACSREEPQPKFSSATINLALRQGSWFKMKSGFSEPSSRMRYSRKSPQLRPGLVTHLSRYFGGMMSVLMLGVGMGGGGPAMAGVRRWVGPREPWRPTKLRFEVEAQRSSGCRRSGFMAMHMEQPGSRHSKPASTRILAMPSSSA